jgi:hypothetical protein
LPVFAEFVYGGPDESSVSGTGQLAITGLLPDPIGEDAENEVVMISNSSNSATSLSGWSLRDRGNNEYLLSGTVPAHGTLEIKMLTFEMPLIISISLVCAVLLFNAGGSLAEITGEDKTILGFSFKAGGAIAGFIIIFIISIKSFELLIDQQPRIAIKKIHLKGISKPKLNTSANYSCQIYLYDTKSGKERFLNPKTGWENGMFTVYFAKADLRTTDFYKLTIENDNKNKWESDTCHISEPIIEIMQIQ